MSSSQSQKRRTLALRNGETLELPERMYVFALEYAKTGNEKQSAKTAGYTEKGFRNQRKKIMARIQPLVFQLQQDTERMVVMDKARIIEELSCIALANPLDYLKPDGTPKQLRELTREQAAAVAHFEVTRDKKGNVTSTYKLHNKLQAIELGGKHFGMFDSRLLIHGMVQHQHQHRHDVVDWAKVPTSKLEQLEALVKEEAERQGVTLEHETGRPSE